MVHGVATQPLLYAPYCMHFDNQLASAAVGKGSVQFTRLSAWCK